MIRVQLDVGVGLSSPIRRSVMFSITKIGLLFAVLLWNDKPYFRPCENVALVEMRDQLRNYFHWLTEVNRFGAWYKIWHYAQFLAAQSHLEHVYGILFLQRAALQALYYSYGNSVCLSVRHTPVLCQNDGT